MSKILEETILTELKAKEKTTVIVQLHTVDLDKSGHYFKASWKRNGDGYSVSEIDAIVYKAVKLSSSTYLGHDFIPHDTNGMSSIYFWVK